MKIVGVGCCPGMLTESAIEIIRKAKRCYGSDRAIHLVEAYLSPDCECHRIKDFKSLRELDDDDAIILSTGDPMFGGLGDLPGEVYPGISSLQLACARLKLPWLNVVTLSVHGKDYTEAIQSVIDELKRGKIVFLLADPTFDLPSFTLTLQNNGILCDIAVCEDLGYETERIHIGSVLSPPTVASPLFCLVLGNLQGK